MTHGDFAGVANGHLEFTVQLIVPKSSVFKSHRRQFFLAFHILGSVWPLTKS